MKNDENVVPVKEMLEPFCMGCPFIAIVVTPCFANNTLHYIKIGCGHMDRCVRTYNIGAIDGSAEMDKQ